MASLLDDLIFDGLGYSLFYYVLLVLGDWTKL